MLKRHFPQQKRTFYFEEIHLQFFFFYETDNLLTVEEHDFSWQNAEQSERYGLREFRFEAKNYKFSSRLRLFDNLVL